MKNFENEFNDWNQYGKEIKEVRNNLIKIISNPDYQSLLESKDINNKLIKALDYIDKFRNLAEERMFQKVNPPNEKRWIEIFYGADKDLKL